MVLRLGFDPGRLLEAFVSPQLGDCKEEDTEVSAEWCGVTDVG